VQPVADFDPPVPRTPDVTAATEAAFPVVVGSADDPGAAAILLVDLQAGLMAYASRATMLLTGGLSLPVSVAEGVDYAPGYHLGRPAPSIEAIQREPCERGREDRHGLLRSWATFSSS
jgi:hypothetical protein